MQPAKVLLFLELHPVKPELVELLQALRSAGKCYFHLLPRELVFNQVRNGRKKKKGP